MAARILDGNSISGQIKAELKTEVAQLGQQGVRPGLAAVLVGENPASHVYVRSKIRTCEQLGIFSEMITPPASTSTEELLAIIDELNRREDIDGILVQLPLPGQIDAKRIQMAVDPAKDVDGFHPTNVGLLSAVRPSLVPCTPAGCMEILRRSGIEVAGKDAVVVGRSDIVGKPVAMLLTNANATVTICHSRTRDLAGVCRRAEILIAAIGKPAMITPEMVNPDATVIDVGINRIDSLEHFRSLFAGDAKREKQFSETGSVLVGDVHPKVAEVCRAITPVPGGVGPMTIAMLMANTLKATKIRRALPHHESS